MDPTADYLRIPYDYAEFLGPMAWSFNGEAIDYREGGVFVFAPQLGQFLEGLTDESFLADPRYANPWVPATAGGRQPDAKGQ